MFSDIPEPILLFEPRSRSGGNNADETHGYSEELEIALYDAPGIEGISIVTERTGVTGIWYLLSVCLDGEITRFKDIPPELTLPLDSDRFLLITPEKGDNGRHAAQ